MNPRRTAPRSAPGEKRREAILKAAWGLFMKKGYAAVSLDEIIRQAGGSKSSIYEFFGNKEGLFIAIINEATGSILKDMALPDAEGMPVRKALKHVGFALGRGILTEKGTGLYWLAVSVSRQLPEVARHFYESAPRTAQRALEDFLRRQAGSGRLRIRNYVRAAEIFTAIVIEHRHLAMSLNCEGPPSDREIEKAVDEAVDIFLKAYGTE